LLYITKRKGFEKKRKGFEKKRKGFEKKRKGFEKNIIQVDIDYMLLNNYPFII